MERELHRERRGAPGPTEGKGGLEWGKAAARHLAARRSRPCLVSCVGCGARGRFSGPMSMARGEGRGPTSFLVSRRARHPPAFRADSAAPHARHTALSARPSAPRAAQLTLTRSPGPLARIRGRGGGATRAHSTANHGPNLAADRTCSHAPALPPNKNTTDRHVTR